MHEKRILGNSLFAHSRCKSLVRQGLRNRAGATRVRAPCPSAGDMQAGDLMIPAQVGRGAAALALIVQPCPGPWKSLPSHPRFKSLAICCRPVLGRSAISDTGRAGYRTRPFLWELRGEGAELGRVPSFLALPFRWFPSGMDLLSLARLSGTVPLALRNRFEDGSASHPRDPALEGSGFNDEITATHRSNGWLEALASSVAGTMGAPHTATRSSCSHHDDGNGNRRLCAASRASAFASAAAAGPSTRCPGK